MKTTKKTFLAGILAILATSAEAQTIGPAFFGMNPQKPLIAPANSPKVFSSRVRLIAAQDPLGNGVQWSDLETSRGVYVWTALDQMVAQNIAQGLQTVYVFNSVPAWANANAGSGVPPTSFQDFYDFVTVLAARYKNKITYYEGWNEANDSKYWTGSIAQMVTLATATYSIIHSIDPKAKTLTPSVEGFFGIAWMDGFLAGGGAVGANDFAVHAYPIDSAPAQPPEQVAQIIGTYKGMLAYYGLSAMPIMVTEGYWGLTGVVNTTALQVAYTAVYLALLASSGVAAEDWFSYDITGEGGITDFGTWLNQRGVAYRNVESWLSGTTFVSPIARQANSSQVRNPTGSGAVAGTQGSCAAATAGTLPTNWSIFAPDSGHGIKTSVVGTGTEDGVAYTDFRVCGTATAGAAGSTSLYFETGTHAVAVNGQGWTVCADTKFAGGSTSGATFSLNYSENDAGGTFLDNPVVFPFNAFAYPIETQSQCFGGVNTSASAAFVQPYVNFIYSVGVPLDVTLRIGAPSIDSGSVWSGSVSRTGGYSGIIAWDAAGGPSTYTPGGAYVSQRDAFGDEAGISTTTVLTNTPILTENTQWKGWLW